MALRLGFESQRKSVLYSPITSVGLSFRTSSVVTRGLRGLTLGEGHLVPQVGERAVEVRQGSLLVQHAAFTGLLDLDLAVVRQVEGGVLGLLVDLARQRLHGVPGGLLIVAYLGVHLDASQVRAQPLEEALAEPALAPERESLLRSRRGVDLTPSSRPGSLDAPSPNRISSNVAEARLSTASGLGPGHAAHLDLADAHAPHDLVLTVQVPDDQHGQQETGDQGPRVPAPAGEVGLRLAPLRTPSR